MTQLYSTHLHDLFNSAAVGRVIELCEGDEAVRFFVVNSDDMQLQYVFRGDTECPPDEDKTFWHPIEALRKALNSVIDDILTLCREFDIDADRDTMWDEFLAQDYVGVHLFTTRIVHSI